MSEFWNRLRNEPQTAKKFLVALVGAISTAISEGLLPDSWSSYVTVTVVFLTALGVYQVPNKEETA